MGKDKEGKKIENIDLQFKKYLSNDFIKNIAMFGEYFKMYDNLENLYLPLYLEVKGLVAMAFRNGPIEDIHADGRISEEEMKNIMKYAVNELYFLLKIRDVCPEFYKLYLLPLFPGHWDDPITKDFDYCDICKKYQEAKKEILKTNKK